MAEDPSSSSGEPATTIEAPLFPLPNVFLGAGMLLPLNVFEPRYCELVRWTLERQRHVAMALYDPLRPPEPDGAPPIFSVVGLGRIEEQIELPGGRYHLFVRGLARCRVLAEDRSRPFRVGRLAVLHPTVHDSAEVHALANMLTARLGLQTTHPCEDDAACAVLTDRMLQFLPLDALTRQSIFATQDLGRRLLAFHRFLDTVQSPASPDRN